jgi:hypothetical protein
MTGCLKLLRRRCSVKPRNILFDSLNTVRNSHTSNGLVVGKSNVS